MVTVIQPTGRFSTTAFLVIVSLLILGSRLLTYRTPAEPDIAVAQVIGHELLRGRELYTDLWDHRPPLTYVANATVELIVGWGAQQVLFLATVLSITTMGAIWYGASALGPFAGAVAAAMWLCVESSVLLQAHQPNGEAFVNAAVAWGAAFMIRGRTRWPPAAAWLLATLAKLNAIAFPAVFAISLIVASRDRQRALRDVGVWLLVGTAGWLGVAGWFAVQDRFAHFWEAIFVYGQYIAFPLLDSIARGLSPQLLLHPIMLTAVPAAAATLAAFLLRPPRNVAVFLAAGLIAAWWAVIIPGWFYRHYYQLYLPFFSIGCGVAAGLMYQRWRAPAVTFAGALLTVAAVLAAPPLVASDEERLLLAYGHTAQYDAEREALPALAAVLKPGETMYQVGNQTSYYVQLRISPPVGVFFLRHMCEKAKGLDSAVNPIADRLTEKTMNRLSANPPAVVVLDSVDAHRCPAHPVFGWLASNYEYRRDLSQHPRAQIFVRVR